MFFYENKVPDYDTEQIILFHYDVKKRNTILSNLKNYKKLKEFSCNKLGLTELPELPDSLKYLECINNKLIKLPNLPNSLTHLYCSHNNLSELHDLPNSLTHLHCNNNNLSELPDLPKSLIEFEYSYNNFIKLPDYNIEEINLCFYNNEIRNTILSNLKNYTNLKKFNCSYYNLKKLPELPSLLTYLDCSDNILTELPELPSSLIKLLCNNNNLTKLPGLPKSLTHLICHNNNLTKLPILPNSLRQLNCYYNNLTILPDLPNSLILFLKHPNVNELGKDIKTINETNSKNRAIKIKTLLDRNLLLENSDGIFINPKITKILLDKLELDFFDSSFDNLTT